MSNSNGIITAPVDFESDVAAVLGINSTDLETLCTSEQINPWSRKKPVPFREMTNENPNWYRGNDGFCGFDVGFVVSGDPGLSNIINAYKNGTWTYTPPQGGDNEPFRILDFEGYNHNAIPFIRSNMPKGKEEELNLLESTVYTFFVFYETVEGSLQIEDFANIGLDGAHLSAAVYSADPTADNSGAKLLTTQISSEPINKRGTITLSFNSNDIGTNKYVVMYLANPNVSRSMCIPYNEKNWYMFKIYVTQKPLIEVTIERMGNASLGYHIPSYYSSTPFPSSNGNADVIFYMKITNNGYSNVNIGNYGSLSYYFRTMFDSRYNTAISPCNSQGTAITVSQTLSKGQSWSGYWKAPRMFKEFVDSYNQSTQIMRAILSIQAYNNSNVGDKAWQSVSPSYPIYVNRNSTWG